MGSRRLQSPSTPPESTSERLDSWKEIAAYLKRDERTVRRWEGEGLPVHRKVHKKQASVYAYRAEIDAWWHDGRQGLEAPEHLGFRKRLTSWVLIGSVVVSLAVLGSLIMGILRNRLRGSAAASIHSLAVLPLENISRDPDEEYFADGMTEELTTELAQISALRVISHTSVAQYKGTKKSMPQIARELGVDGVVEGAVERSGDKIGIMVQLIQAPTDSHLWAKSYQRGLTDVLALQREVTRAIVDELQAKLTAPEKVHLATAQPIRLQLYDEYLRGQFSYEKGELRKSIAYFQQAIQKDPNYALAYAGLANSYVSLGEPWYQDMRPTEVLPQAKAAAMKALELDDSLGEAHLALARAIQLYDWDWPAVEKEYRRSIELNQNDVVAHLKFAEFLQEMGRNDESLAELRRAAILDPLNSGPVANFGFVFYTARRYDEAIPEFQKALKMNPETPDAHVGLGWVYEQKKTYSDAIHELETALNQSNRHELALASLGQVLGESGRKAEATKVLDELQRRSQHRYISPSLVALVLIGLGQRDRAIASLEKGYVSRDQWLLYLKVDPHMDALRSDPRFKDIVRRVGLP